MLLLALLACQDPEPPTTPAAEPEPPADEPPDGVWFRDADGDGVGDASVAQRSAGEGWVSEPGDCDDADDSIHPGADEVCRDGVDSDCDGLDGACDALGSGDAALVMVGDSRAQPLAMARGDLDGDGVDELIVGSGGGSSSGYGSSSWGEVAVISAPLEGSEIDALAIGDVVDTDTRWLSVSAGDLDGDGVDELIVGDPAATGEAQYGGQVRVYAGGEAAIMVLGPDICTYLGDTLGVGDLDGDGADELLVEDRLGARVVLMMTTGGWEEEVRLPDALPDGLWALTGEEVTAGSWILGDVDGDGLDDVGLIGDGESWLVPSGALSPQAAFADVGTALAAHGTLYPDAEIGHVGDLDGDGYAETGLAEGSTLRIAFGGPAAPVVGLEVSGEGALWRLGAVGDVSRDGLDDLVVGLESDGDGGAAVWAGPVPEGVLSASDADQWIEGGGAAVLTMPAADTRGPLLLLADPDAADGVGAIYGFAGLLGAM